ncbi:elongation factor G [Terricaulis silvestris]|uniref:Elongation factor G n=1 Tax=Terricaulis silvestris TaxID=2686094 RepID=A0A6I6MFQ2_9CAUL|nr:elongation factor G [Terricaulis silvestris]QGZ93310.1 Elongation factor G [Terricaulis silvestris]
MAESKSANIVRAIAVVGPTGAGKTALIQALASAASGGSGSAPTAAGQSTETSFTAIDFMGDHYALIDAPGAVDFLADSDFALPAVDLAIVVADPDPEKAVLVQPFLKVLEDQNIPRALFINKIDQARGRVRDLLEALQPVSAVPLVARQIPIWEDEKVTGFVDLALERAYHYEAGKPSSVIDIPKELAERETEARFHMLEQLADYDDTLMEQLLSDTTPDRDTVFADLVRELREGLITPVFFGSTAGGHGVRRLLKAFRHDTPAPQYAAERLGLKGVGAYVMKISHAGQAGKLAYSRVFGGKLSESDQVALSDGSSGRAAALFSVSGAQTKKIATAPEGDVVAIGKLDPVAAGDILVASGKAEAIKIERKKRFPVYQLAIATKDRKDDVRLSGALQKLVEEDAGLEVVHDQVTHEILLQGQGEPHLRSVIDRLKGRFGVDVSSTRPSTPYKETIRKSAEKRGRHKKQTGGHGQFGDCVIQVKPQPRGRGFEFVDKITGGAIPRQWIPAVEGGVKDAMAKGPIGFPVVDVSVTLIDGSFHAVDSSEHSFHSAGRIGMNDALAECEPVLLEPIEKLSIHTPSWGTPKINSAVSSHGGQILGFEPRDGWNGWDRVDVYLPHAERQNFIIELRSLTQGLATFEASFDHMVEVTGRRAEDVAKRAAQQATT